MVDIYKNAARFEKQRTRLPGWPLHPGNRPIVEQLVDERIALRSPGRRHMQLCVLKRLCCGTRTGKPALILGPVAEWRSDDVSRIAAQLRGEALRSDVAQSTFKELRFLLRELLRRGLEQAGRSDMDAMLKHLATVLVWPAERVEDISISRYYTYDEFSHIMRLARLPQERALLAVAWETTARPNEYLTLRVGDVEETPYGFSLRAHVSKQTGARTRTRLLYVVVYTAELARFLHAHPNRDRPDAPLFYRDHCPPQRGLPLGSAGANKILQKYDARSGVNKRGTLYFLRHGGYTHKILQGMHPTLAGADMGWIPGSQQQRRYTHLTDHDVLRERLRLAGQRFEQEVRPQLRARICPACNQSNGPDATHCGTCGQVLDITNVLRELETLKANQTALVERALAGILAKYGLEAVERP